MIKKYYTLLIASDSNRFNRSFKISSFTMYLYIIIFILILIFSYLGFMDQINMGRKTIEYNNLKEFKINIVNLITNQDEFTQLSDSVLIRDIKEIIKNGGPKISLIAPIDGFVTQALDAQNNHHGIDLVSEKGDQIIAPQDGIVVFSGINGYLGNTLIISHIYNYFTLYGHCDKLLVHERDRVFQGDIIATLGESGQTTAPHLHFEIWHNDSIIDPRDIINKYGELDVSTE